MFHISPLSFLGVSPGTKVSAYNQIHHSLRRWERGDLSNFVEQLEENKSAVIFCVRMCEDCSFIL